ncbi:MAG: hypothetical protein JO277_10370, partial [Candidatus Eremiobacteraeota bacterium]|nr:hypothetical protein [Candidatus Eremiobacteraeota bacterium]
MRSISLNAAISVAVCFIPTAALADDPFAQVNHGFSVKARFLSSEQPAGGFWVVNKSPHDVYVRLGSFHVQMWSGRAWVDDPASGSYQRPEQEQRMEPRISEVSAAEFLPRCTATSEPCVQYVRATYAIRVGSVVRNFATPVQRYDVVADATATFDLWSSMDDRPTFLTISGSGKPDVLVLHYTLGTAGELLPGGVLTSELLDEFRRFGVLVTRDRMDDATTFRIAGAPNQAEHVRDATTAIAAEYGSYFRSVETYFAIDSSRLQRQDLVDADATASRYAKLVGSEQPGGTAIWPPQQPIRLFPTQTAGADPFAGALQRTLTAAHDSIAVLNPYTAAGHARLDLDAGVRAAASRLAEPAHVEGVVLPRIPIEGDRAEIYGIASVQNEAALHAGVSPEGAAIVQADARVHALATALGAAPGELSLLTQLPT